MPDTGNGLQFCNLSGTSTSLTAQGPGGLVLVLVRSTPALVVCLSLPTHIPTFPQPTGLGLLLLRAGLVLLLINLQSLKHFDNPALSRTPWTTSRGRQNVQCFQLSPDTDTPTA